MWWKGFVHKFEYFEGDMYFLNVVGPNGRVGIFL